LHAKPTALLDVDGFWQPQLAQLQRMVDDGYLAADRLAALGVVHDAAGLLAFVAGYRHPARKWTSPPPAA
jgi:predicted Rossmann-fold nucleotide-binding protein